MPSSRPNNNSGPPGMCAGVDKHVLYTVHIDVPAYILLLL